MTRAYLRDPPAKVFGSHSLQPRPPVITLLSTMRTPTLHHVHLHHGPTGRGEDARVRVTA
jgi:hypothetical protein